jgi:hypothetical protein
MGILVKKAFHRSKIYELSKHQHHDIVLMEYSLLQENQKYKYICEVQGVFRLNKEYTILVIAWIITINLLIRYVPRNRSREAWLVFLFKLFLTWIFGLLVVELDMIEYPIRFFMEASRTSFTFEFFVYPAICVLFNLHYPEGKGKGRQWMHYVYYCSGITIIEVFLEKNTRLIIYTNWEWYWTWITLFVTFYMSRKFYLWFFKPYSKVDKS